MTTPLAIWPSVPTGGALAALKQAKQQIPDAPLVSPVRAVPGSPGRVLAIGERPPFLCDYALVAEATPERIKPALEWVLGLREDERGMTVLKKLKQIFGPETTEVTREDEIH